MITQETSLYPIDTNQVVFYFCIHRYKRRTKNKIGFFILLTIQKIKKGKGRYFKKYIKKKESDVLKKRQKVLGFVLGLAQWCSRKDGSAFRANKNFVLIFRGVGKWKKAIEVNGVSGLKPQTKKLRGGVPREVILKRNLETYPFLKGFHFKKY